MDQQPEAGPRVEFLDSEGSPVAVDDDEQPVEPPRGRPTRYAYVVAGAMAASAVITFVSVFMTQLTFYPADFNDPTLPSYAVDGLGRYHLLGPASPRFAIDGHAPALGWVAIVCAVLLVVAAAATIGPSRRAIMRDLNAAVACFAAGGIVAVLACEALEGSEYTKHSWAAGFWLLVLGGGVSGLVSLLNAVRRGRHELR